MNTIAVLKTESARLKSLARRIDDLVRDLSSGDEPPTDNTSAPQLPAPLGKSLLDTVEEILRERGTPLARNTLIEMLPARGVEAPDPDRLSEAMSRDGRFSGVGRGRGAKWWVSDTPLGGPA